MKQNIINTPIANFTSVNVQERRDIGVRSGDTVKVWVKIKEKAKNGERIRLQAFEGIVLSVKHGKENGASFTVRKVSNGVGIERIFPLYSPVIDKIEIVKRSSVRRSKLYHIREKVAREIKRQMRKTKLLGLSTVSDVEYQENLVKEAEEAAAQAEAAETEATEVEETNDAAAEVKEEATTDKVATEEAPAEEEVKEEVTEEEAPAEEKKDEA